MYHIELRHPRERHRLVVVTQLSDNALACTDNGVLGHFINLSSVARIKVFAADVSVYSGMNFAHAISEGSRMGTQKDNIRVE